MIFMRDYIVLDVCRFINKWQKVSYIRFRYFRLFFCNFSSSSCFFFYFFTRFFFRSHLFLFLYAIFSVRVNKQYTMNIVMELLSHPCAVYTTLSSEQMEMVQEARTECKNVNNREQLVSKMKLENVMAKKWNIKPFIVFIHTFAPHGSNNTVLAAERERRHVRTGRFYSNNVCRIFYLHLYVLDERKPCGGRLLSKIAA